MTISELREKDKDRLTEIYMTMAEYAAYQCTGCSDSPMILAFKAQQAMLEANDKGENPLERLNTFLGTSIPEDVLLSIIEE